MNTEHSKVGPFRRVAFCSRAVAIVLAIVALTVAALWRGLPVLQSYWRDEAIAAIRESGGRVRSLKEYLSDDPLLITPGEAHELAAQPGEVAEVSVVTDSEMRYLPTFPKLQSLLLGRRVSDRNLDCLRQMKGLRELWLMNSAITDDGLNAIVGAVPGLFRLDIVNTRITDDGLRNLIGLRGLTILGLQGRKLSDVGIENLKALSQLKMLHLDGTRVSNKQGIAELRLALPKCEIEW